MIKQLTVATLISLSLAACNEAEEPKAEVTFTPKSDDGTLTPEERKNMTKEEVEYYGREQVDKLKNAQAEQNQLLIDMQKQQ